MPALTVKNIPEPLYAQLKANAQAHHRSLNGELINCLEQALFPQKINVSQYIANVRVLRQQVQENVIDIDDISNAIARGRE